MPGPVQATMERAFGADFSAEASTKARRRRPRLSTRDQAVAALNQAVDELRQSGRAAAPLELIGKMYRIEAASKAAGEWPHELLLRRQRETKPLFDAWRMWLDEHTGRIPPKSPLARPSPMPTTTGTR